MNAFISYSHKDAQQLDKLHEHLSALRREGLLETWTDREIHAGGEIDKEVDAAMEAAELFLLLVSASFLNSNYCFEREFQRAQEKQAAKKAIIVPLILKEVDWEISALRKYKALPDDGKPVISRHWHSDDEGFANIAKGLRKMLKAFASDSAKKPAANNAPAKAIFTPDNTHITIEQETLKKPSILAPKHEFAKELLEAIFEHPNPEERGLTEILHSSPSGPLNTHFIPNITGAGGAPAARKSVFKPAVAELLSLGWLLQPEGDSKVRMYELNPHAPCFKR